MSARAQHAHHRSSRLDAFNRQSRAETDGWNRQKLEGQKKHYESRNACPAETETEPRTCYLDLLYRAGSLRIACVRSANATKH